MALVMRTGPAAEPLSVEEAKAHLRIDGTAEDALIASLILTSRLHIEAALGLALIAQGWTLVLDQWPKDGTVKIPIRPVLGVGEVRVIDRDGNAAVVAAPDYQADVANTPARVVSNGAGWPAPGQKINGIEIDFDAGYGAAAGDVPAPIKQALLMLVAHWYEHRDPLEIGSPSVAIPVAISNLLKPYRLVRL